VFVPILGDFEYVTTGGNYSATKAFTTTFNSGGRHGGSALAYLLVEFNSYPASVGAAASTEFRINGKLVTTLPALGGPSVEVVRFPESRLYAQKANTFQAIGKNAWGSFGNVICHFHQETS
jgi:hypothetical protein